MPNYNLPYRHFLEELREAISEGNYPKSGLPPHEAKRLFMNDSINTWKSYEARRKMNEDKVEKAKHLLRKNYDAEKLEEHRQEAVKQQRLMDLKKQEEEKIKQQQDEATAREVVQKNNEFLIQQQLAEVAKNHQDFLTQQKLNSMKDMQEHIFVEKTPKNSFTREDIQHSSSTYFEFFENSTYKEKEYTTREEEEEATLEDYENFINDGQKNVFKKKNPNSPFPYIRRFSPSENYMWDSLTSNMEFERIFASSFFEDIDQNKIIDQSFSHLIKLDFSLLKKSYIDPKFSFPKSIDNQLIHQSFSQFFDIILQKLSNIDSHQEWFDFEETFLIDQKNIFLGSAKFLTFTTNCIKEYQRNPKKYPHVNYNSLNEITFQSAFIFDSLFKLYRACDDILLHNREPHSVYKKFFANTNSSDFNKYWQHLQHTSQNPSNKDFKAHLKNNNDTNSDVYTAFYNCLQLSRLTLLKLKFFKLNYTLFINKFNQFIFKSDRTENLKPIDTSLIEFIQNNKTPDIPDIIETQTKSIRTLKI